MSLWPGLASIVVSLHVVGTTAGAQPGRLPTALAFRSWDIADSLGQRCANQPVAGACPVADTALLVWDDDEAIRLVFRRDNPCAWSPRATWTLRRDTIRVEWSFPDAHADVPCPAHVHWDAWQTRIAPLTPGPYVVAFYLTPPGQSSRLLAAQPIALNSPDPIAPPALQRIQRDALCVTNGDIVALPDGRMAVNTRSSRAVLRIPTAAQPQVAELRFRYMGPSADSKALASGEMRRQIALKLRAQDQCNLLYAAWHIEPDAKFGVSVKRNPGQSTHEQCEAHGYVTIKPRTSTAMPRILAGESHTFRAELHGDDLSLYADNQMVWNGPVGAGVADINGPVGLRTDNARFEFEFYVRPPEPGAPSTTVDDRLNRCQPSPDD